MKKMSDTRGRCLSLAHLYVAYSALALGGLAGLLQVLIRSGGLTLPAGIGYYQILTVHGVLLGLILTTFFIIGFLHASIIRTAGPYSNRSIVLGWLGFWIMLIGTLMSATMILLNEATVLYTFYAPLMAHWLFYLGLTFVVVGSWFSGAAMISAYRHWRKEHPGQTSPLLTFMAIITIVLWIIATLGVAGTILFQLLPWSLGIVERVDVLTSRTLFWYFGHPLVYFWLLPAYMAWYAVIPKVIGGRVFSDSLARLSFLLFLLFSIPVGFHHQLVEPGIDAFWKYLQVVLTFMVVIPSLMTAFSLFATFEIRGRELGSKGLFGWLRKLPWKDARFTVPFIGMLAFIPAGAGGLINASNQMNQVVHNTIWVTGHFHLTLATTVVLTFFGISYWLIPHLTGRVLTKEMNRLAIIQAIVWTVGMGIMSLSMHAAGLLGAPRRSAFSTYGDAPQALAWIPYQAAQAIGGTILFIGIILVLYIVVNLAFFSPKGTETFPVADSGSAKTPKALEDWRIWLTILTALILIAYSVPFIDMIQQAPPASKGYRLW